MKYERKVFRVWSGNMSWHELPLTFRTRVDQNNEVTLCSGISSYSIEEVEDMLKILKEENKKFKEK